MLLLIKAFLERKSLFFKKIRRHRYIELKKNLLYDIIRKKYNAEAIYGKSIQVL